MYSMLLAALLMSTPPVFATAEHRAASFIELPGELTEVILYHPNGNIAQKGYMVDGKKTGVWITYAANGEIMAKARYVQGEKQGKWRVYDAEGNLEYTIYYRQNKKVWAQQYDDAGNLTAFSHD